MSQSMSFFIYNSLTQKKEKFEPLNPPQVKMYCCGPTVYDLLHIGNFRGAVFFNFLRQWLEYKGYQVIYAYNFTDVDDKILHRSKKENKTMKEIADKYISEFKKDFNNLKLRKHDYNPQATQFIPNMVELIEQLLEKGKAYTVNQDVFFSVDDFPDYGKLSGQKAEGMLSGSRVEVNDKKKDPKDFALWKSCPKTEPGWQTPWGYGRPGWHLECTSMIFSLLGNNIDIHGGGTDLIFPHHENELAQAEGAKKGPFVKYWVHNNMFTFGGEKMAKSTGNVSVMRSFLKQYNGEIFKFLVLSSHYRSMTEVSDNKILQCIQALSRIYTFLKTADEKIKALDIISESIDLDSIKTVYDESVDLFELNLEQIQKKYTDKLKAIKWPIEALDKKEISAVFKDIQLATKNIEDNLNDDLNTPAFFAVLFTVIRRFNDKKNSSKWSDKAVVLYAIFARNLIVKYGKIMSLFQEPPELFLKEIDNIFLAKNKLTKKEIDTLVKERDRARKNKNFKKADEIRSQLMNMKIEVKDSPEGTTWETKRYL